MRSMLLPLLLLFLIFACGSNRGGPGPSPVPEPGWTEHDTHLVARELVAEMLSRSWVQNIQAITGHTPVLLLGVLRNESGEQIDLDILAKELSRELLSSGMLRLVAPREEHDLHAASAYSGDQDPVRQRAEDTGADLILQGCLQLIRDQNGTNISKRYELTLQLLRADSGEMVWTGRKIQIKILK